MPVNEDNKEGEQIDKINKEGQSRAFEIKCSRNAVDWTHNWLSRGMVGSIRSPREELQWSTEVILVLTKQPLECRCNGRAFPSLVGDIRDFSTPSNWTVMRVNSTEATFDSRIWWIDDTTLSHWIVCVV